MAYVDIYSEPDILRCKIPTDVLSDSFFYIIYCRFLSLRTLWAICYNLSLGRPLKFYLFEKRDLRRAETYQYVASLFIIIKINPGLKSWKKTIVR